MARLSKPIAATRIQRKWRRRRNVRRAIRRYNVPKNKQTHFHVRRITALKEGDWNVDTDSGTGAYYRALAFRLSDLQDYTELAALYDQYMITKIVLDFNWTLVPVGTSGLNPSYSPQMNLVKDYDDDTTPDGAYFRSSGRNIRKRLTANNPFRIAITPAVNIQAYQSLTSSGYIPKWKQRIDMSDIDVPHYGAKIQILCPATSNGYIQITARYYVSCFQTR